MTPWEAALERGGHSTGMRSTITLVGLGRVPSWTWESWLLSHFTEWSLCGPAWMCPVQDCTLLPGLCCGPPAHGPAWAAQGEVSALSVCPCTLAALLSLVTGCWHTMADTGKESCVQNTEEQPIYLQGGWHVTTHWRGLILPCGCFTAREVFFPTLPPPSVQTTWVSAPQGTLDSVERGREEDCFEAWWTAWGRRRGRSQMKGCTGRADTWRQLLRIYCKLFSQNFTCLSHLTPLRSFSLGGDGCNLKSWQRHQWNEVCP